MVHWPWHWNMTVTRWETYHCAHALSYILMLKDPLLCTKELVLRLTLAIHLTNNVQITMACYKIQVVWFTLQPTTSHTPYSFHGAIWSFSRWAGSFLSFLFEAEQLQRPHVRKGREGKDQGEPLRGTDGQPGATLSSLENSERQKERENRKRNESEDEV